MDLLSLKLGRPSPAPRHRCPWFSGLPTRTYTIGPLVLGPLAWDLGSWVP